ncbi:MAG: DUF6814 family protein [Chitinophagaceae bacterium]
MNTLKKYLGVFWMILSPITVAFLTYETVIKYQEALPQAKANTLLQWCIILLIFIPIAIGFFIFGKYAYQNEYTTKD